MSTTTTNSSPSSSSPSIASTTFRWVYYASTMAITYAACHLYHHDVARINLFDLHHHRTSPASTTTSSSTPAYPWLLLTLNMAVVLLIWTHFLYQTRSLALTTVVVIALISAYRKLVTPDFCLPMNGPLLIAAGSALAWVVADIVQEEKEFKEEKRKKEFEAKKEEEEEEGGQSSMSTTTTSTITTSDEQTVAITMPTAPESPSTPPTPPS